jgi:hypothetical protein
MLQSISLIRSTYNFKKCTTELNYNYFYFYFYLHTLKMGANDVAAPPYGLQLRGVGAPPRTPPPAPLLA